jgi:hypothetical protein
MSPSIASIILKIRFIWQQLLAQSEFPLEFASADLLSENSSIKGAVRPFINISSMISWQLAQCAKS